MKFLRITIGVILLLSGLALAYAGMTIFSQYWLYMIMTALLLIGGGIFVIVGDSVRETIRDIFDIRNYF